MQRESGIGEWDPSAAPPLLKGPAPPSALGTESRWGTQFSAARLTLWVQGVRENGRHE